MTIYLAGPLFSEAERNWHRNFKDELEKSGLAVLWPYEMVEAQNVRADEPDAAKKIMEICLSGIEQSDMVVALLDGAQVDDGTAWELGYAFAKKIPAIGIRTDFRLAGDTGTGKVNAMIAGNCKIFGSRRECIEYLKNLWKKGDC